MGKFSDFAKTAAKGAAVIGVGTAVGAALIGKAAYDTSKKLGQKAVDEAKELKEKYDATDEMVMECQKNYNEEASVVRNLIETIENASDDLKKTQTDIIDIDFPRLKRLCEYALDNFIVNEDINSYTTEKVDDFGTETNIIHPKLANDVAKGVIYGLGGSGAAVTGTIMFGTAGTGAAISGLSGAAATNATLAALGGGSIATGGFGMVGGMAVLGGMMVLPVLMSVGYAQIKNIKKNYQAALDYKKDIDEKINELRKRKSTLLLLQSNIIKLNFATKANKIILEQFLDLYEKSLFDESLVECRTLCFNAYELTKEMLGMSAVQDKKNINNNLEVDLFNINSGFLSLQQKLGVIINKDNNAGVNRETFEAEMKRFEQEKRRYEELLRTYAQEKAGYENALKAYESDLKQAENNKKQYNDLLRLYEDDKKKYENVASKYEQEKKRYEEAVRRLEEERQKHSEEKEHIIKTMPPVVQVKEPYKTYILQNREIRLRFEQTFHDAKKAIYIMSPWVNDRIINGLNDHFLEAFSKGVHIYIAYGINDDNSMKGKKGYSRDKASQNAIKNFKETYKKYKEQIHTIRQNSHAKLLICDDTYYVMGSFNLLSFDGNYSGKDTRGELADCSYNVEMLKQYKKEFFNFY